MTPPAIPKSVLQLAMLTVAGVYFFVTAPPDLDAPAGGGREVPVEVMFRLLDAENASVRALYTAEIVTPGLKIGLRFHEDWRKKEVAAGPLPALVLRETANRLQQSVPELNLFLGSRFPIEASNGFEGAQSTYFTRLEETGEPQFFLDESTGRYTAMFPDVASAPGCVTCHNEHPKSPRKDWKLHDTMGATTWSFPRERVSADELLSLVAAYRASALDTYAAYLKEVESFDASERPALGERWPEDGRFLPDLATFRRRVVERNSPPTLNWLLQGLEGAAAATTAPSGPSMPSPAEGAPSAVEAGRSP